MVRSCNDQNVRQLTCFSCGELHTALLAARLAYRRVLVAEGTPNVDVPAGLGRRAPKLLGEGLAAARVVLQEQNARLLAAREPIRQQLAQMDHVGIFRIIPAVRKVTVGVFEVVVAQVLLDTLHNKRAAQWEQYLRPTQNI